MNLLTMNPRSTYIATTRSPAERRRRPAPASCVRLIALLGLVSSMMPAVAQGDLAVGDVETFRALPAGHHPEGIAFDRDGNLYYGNRRFAPFAGFDSELHKITPDGKHDTIIATFARSPLNALLGLATDRDGNVWAAMHGGADHGVWRISSNGKLKQRVAGSENIHFPNAMVFDAQGNLYVTDSGPVVPPVGGAIWRLRDGKLEKWSEDPTLAPLPTDPLGLTLPGANGITFVPPNSLYVANNEKGQLLRFPIRADGTAGAPVEVTPPFSLIAIDGIAADTQGNIHCVLAGSLVVGTLPLVKVNPTTGAITRTSSLVFDQLFDIGLSVAFNTGPNQQTYLFVTTGDLDSVNPNIPPVGLGARLLRVNVGVKGLFLGQ